MRVTLGWNYWTSIPFRSDVWWHRLKSLYPKQNTRYAGTWFKPTQAIQIPPAHEVMPIIGDDLSARQRECEDAPRRAAKELRWQAWSTAWKDLEDGQWRISCVSSMHLYMSPKKIGMKKHTLEYSRWVSMICLTPCRRSAFCQRTHRGAILTSVKWYAPTSKMGSTAMGDLQCVFVHLCCRDLPTSTPFRSFF